MMNIVNFSCSHEQNLTVANKINEIINSNKLKMKFHISFDDKNKLIKYCEKVSKKNGEIFAYFLDLDDTESNGIELAKSIRKADPKCYIIILTTRQKFTRGFFEIKMFDCIFKPIEQLGLRDTLKALEADYVEYIKTINNFNLIKVQAGRKVENIAYKNILYIERDKNSAIIQTVNKQRIRCKNNFNDIKKKLPEYFIQFNKTYIVNTCYVSRCNTQEGYIAIKATDKQCAERSKSDGIILHKTEQNNLSTKISCG